MAGVVGAGLAPPDPAGDRPSHGDATGRARSDPTPIIDTRHAFDGVAATYHQSNVENRILCAMRERLWRAVDGFVPPGSHLLDLGCGPGTDAERFAARGYRVTAIDWSPAMAEQARRRVRDAGAGDLVDVRPLGIHELDRLAPDTFDAACANLGPLNCVPDLAGAARLIGGRLRPGGVLVASVMGRVCPWEIALYAARRDWTRLRVRFTPSPAPVPLGTRTVWTRYYAPSAFERAFAAEGFSRVALRTLGLFVPPPYMQAFADRHPALVACLQRIEDRVGDWPGLRAWGDHFLIVLKKTGPAQAGRHVHDERVDEQTDVRAGVGSVRLQADRDRMWMPRFACPECGTDLRDSGFGVRDSKSDRAPNPEPRMPDVCWCTRCGRRFEYRDGVWRFLTPGRAARLEPFLAQYRTVRERDGHRRGSPAYYRMLPAVAAGDPHADEWRVRRETYRHLLRHVLAGAPERVRVLDVGAGSGWLSHCLSRLGHRAVALDVLDDEADGLGAIRHYPSRFPAVQADFDALPFVAHQFDLVAFNGSLHYAPDATATLACARDMLAPGGALAVMDSPMFQADEDGRAMTGELTRRLQSQHGLAAVVQPGAGYLTFPLLDAAARALALRPAFVPSRGPLGWRLRRGLARLRLRRAPAAFGLWVAR